MGRLVEVGRVGPDLPSPDHWPPTYCVLVDGGSEGLGLGVVGHMLQRLG